ncbi:MAG: dihydroorotate dehydrogenase [Eubacteriaceae bacterium]|nr:dihydroorotate dehydrogenase [Eubacteriaceae bacterium]
MSKLSVDFLGLSWKNPLAAASGTFGFGESYKSLFDPSIIGAICTKGITLEPKEGNSGIRIWETESGLLNSIGLENPGIDSFIYDILPEMGNLGTIIIANVGGDTVDSYLLALDILNSADDVGMIELNISCPNVKAGGMAFGVHPKDAYWITQLAKQVTDKPMMVKLSPNAYDITECALAAESAGADGISLVNTFQAMAIDIAARKPVFDNVYAGLSGPAIKPIALRMLHQTAKAVSVPICGIGGISSAQDVIEFMMAGASVVQVGSAVFKDPYVYGKILAGLDEFMEKEGLHNISEIVGAAL